MIIKNISFPWWHLTHITKFQSLENRQSISPSTFMMESIASPLTGSCFSKKKWSTIEGFYISIKMVYNSRFLYELPKIHNVIQKQQKKKKKQIWCQRTKNSFDICVQYHVPTQHLLTFLVSSSVVAANGRKQIK